VTTEETEPVRDAEPLRDTEPPAGTDSEQDVARPWSGSIYGALWRRLPGAWWVRTLLVVVGLAAVVVLLFGVVFPFVEPRLPFNQVTVDDPGTTPSPGAG
jgi:hypothetical protein